MDKKKVVIIVIVVLLIIVIGVVAYTMSSSTPAPVAQKPAIAAKPATASTAAATAAASVAATASTAAAQLDPCAGTNDNSTNLSVECLRKIWRDSGCGNPSGIIADNYNGWWKQQTKKVVIDDMKAWATSTDVERRTACYGDDRTKWPTFVQITRPSMNPGWYPYGATANFVKSTIGVTNLESAISYARANGYSAFAFNENPTTSTDSNLNDTNSKILFFKEAEINTSTFFTSGAAVPGFKVYAARDSKLKSSETFSFNLPQYLRHLQNKNYLL